MKEFFTINNTKDHLETQYFRLNTPKFVHPRKANKNYTNLLDFFFYDLFYDVATTQQQ